MEIDRSGLEVLDRDECLRLLRTQSLGRIGLSSGALPSVLPVSFGVDGDRILIRTSGGSQLHSAARDAVVAFEADDFDPSCRVGWSVMVIGVAREVVDPASMSRMASLPVPRWAGDGDDRLVAISIELVSGRRLVSMLDGAEAG